LAFISAGALITLIGVRELLVAAGVGGVVAWLVSLRALATAFNDEELEFAGQPVSGASADAFGHGGASQQRADLVGGAGHSGGARLDQGTKGLDDGGVELSPGTGS
jgi:hypothetical protein